MLLQFDWNKLRPERIVEQLFGLQILERTPAFLSLFYLACLVLVVSLLFLSFIRNRRLKSIYEENLPSSIKRKLSTTSANRSLFVWQIFFVFLTFFVYGFHVYWTVFADDSNEEFQALNYKDLRNRRASASTLRGWMLDRSGKLSGSLAYYKHEPDGGIVRSYALEKEMAHLLGTERGTPGLERVLFRSDNDPMPESYEVLTTIKRKEDLPRDVKITIDRDLQVFAAKQLEGKKGAIVVINPQTGELLAAYSNPTFALSENKTLSDWLKLEGNTRDKPLLNRAFREYYVPGSTFKTFTMISGFRNGKQNIQLTSSPEGFVAFRGSRPIFDAVPPCEPPYGCGTLNIAQAFEASSNQFFSQLAVELGRDRIRETANMLGISAVETPEDAINAKLFPDIWNASTKRIQNALAPRQSTIVTGKEISNYDIGLEGMGQGYAGQMTPFQMALIASVAGNMEGKLMKTKIEFDLPPQMFSQILTPQQALDIRNIMALVTEGSGGTAKVVSRMLSGTGVRVGGKTGTAEKSAPLYDEKTGKLKTTKKKRKDDKGNLVEYDAPQMYERTDSWFVAVAPLEKPQLAIAVVVEGGGFGAKIAAPIAANLILKSRELGLLGEQYKPKTVVPKTATPGKKKNK
jgi:Penicillin binding protein transpeptidase domain